MYQEVETAMQTNDLRVLEATLKLARETGVEEKKLVKAVELLELLKKKEACLESLRAAASSGDIAQLEAALAAGKHMKVTDSAEFNECQRVVDEARAAMQKLADATRKKAEREAELAKAREAELVKAEAAAAAALESGKLAEQETQAEQDKKAEELKNQEAIAEKADQEYEATLAVALALGLGGGQEGGENKVAEAQKKRDEDLAKEAVTEALKNAIEAKNKQLLKSALDRAKASKLHNTPLAEEARNLFDELQQEEDYHEQELNAAKQNVNEDVIIEAAAPAAKSDESAAAPVAQFNDAPVALGDRTEFDASKYSVESYRLAKYPNLRPANDFISGKYFLNSKKAKQGMMKFTKDAIPKTLTKIDNENSHNEGIGLFKSVQGFMGDRHYSFPETLVSEMIEKMLDFAALRTEAYVQVMKQLDGNPKKDSEIKGWQLLCLLTENIAPAQDFIYYYLFFLNKHAEDAADPVIQGYAKYAMHTLQDTVNRGLPKKPPATPAGPTPICRIEHVQAFSQRTMFEGKVRITLPDASEVEISINPWQKAGSCLPMVAKLISLTDLRDMAFFEIKKDNICAIEDAECLLDFQNQWVKEEKQEQEVQKNKSRFKFLSKSTEVKSSSEAVETTNRFLFCRRLYGTPIGESTCPVMQCIMAFQAARDVSSGMGAYDIDVAVNISAAAKVTFTGTKRIGNLTTTTPDDWTATSLWGRPATFGKKVSDSDYEKKVTAAVGSHKTSVPALLSLCTKLPLFGAQHFQVEQQDNAEWPLLLTMAINFYGVHLLDLATKKQIVHFPIMNILGWSNTPVRILLRVKLANAKKGDGNVNNMSCRFRTATPRMAKEICDLLLCYAQEMVKAINIHKKVSK